MALNKLQLHAASTCVYLNDFKFSAYVQDLWRQEKPFFLKPNLGAVVEAPGYSSETGALMGGAYFTTSSPNSLTA